MKGTKLIIMDGGGTIWNSMEVLYEHYKIGALYFGLIKRLADFPYDLNLMNELSSFQSFNSRSNIAKILTALLIKKINNEELSNYIDSDDAEDRLKCEIIAPLINSNEYWQISHEFGKFLQNALYNYPEEWYPLSRGVKTALGYIKNKGYKIAMLSNRRKDSVTRILKSHNTYDYFDHIEAPEGVYEPTTKPLKKVLEKFQVQEKDAYFIGDSLLDIKSAKSQTSNIPVIAVLSGMSTKRIIDKLEQNFKPQYVISDLSKIKEIIG